MTLKRVLPCFVVLVSVLILRIQPAVAQTVLSFPRVIADLQSYTGIAVGNPTATEVSVTFTAFQPDGSLVSGTDVRNPATITIPAGGQMARVASEIFGFIQFDGWVEATSRTSGLTGFFLNGSGLNAMDGAASVQPALEHVLPIAVHDETAKTEITVVNGSSDSAQATLTLYARDGRALVSKDVTLPARGFIRQGLALLFAQSDIATSSHIRVRSDRPVLTYDVVNDFLLPGSTVRREPIAIAGRRPAAAQTYVFPHFASGNDWISFIGLVNAAGVGQEITLTAYREDGSIWAAPMNPRHASLDANAGLRETVGDLFGFAGNGYFTGWIAVTSSLGFLDGYIGYGNTSTSSFALAALIDAASASRLQAFSQVAEGSGYYTGLTVVNPGNTPATIDFFTMRADGTTVGHSTLTLGANERVARLFRELLPAAFEQVGGWGFIRSSQPVIGASLFGSTNGQALASVPAQAPAAGFAPPPQLTAAITGSVLFAGSAVQNAQVTLSGPVIASRATDVFGDYIFTQLPKGQYTVTVSKFGTSFALPRRNVTIERDNVDKVDFEAVAVIPASTPIINFISPASAFAGNRFVNVSVFGSSFTPSSVVTLNDKALQTAFVSSSELHAVLPQSELAGSHIIGLFVETPPPGGGRAGPLNLVVTAVPQNPLIEGQTHVGSVPSGVAIDTKRNRALVTNQSADSVSVIDLRTFATVATITVGRSPADGIAISAARDVALIPNPGSNTVSVIDLATNSEIKRITVGTFPVGVAIDDGLRRAFVSNQSAGTISVIDLDSLVETGKFPAGQLPANVALNTRTHIGIVSNPPSNTVTVFDAATGSALRAVPGGSRPRGVAINPDTNQAFVVNANSNDVWIIDLGSMNVVRKISVGSGPTDVAIHAITNSAVVSNSMLSATQREAGVAGSVSVIQLATGEITEIAVGTTPFGVAVDPENQRAVVANFGSDDVTVVHIPNPKPKITDILPKTFSAGAAPFTVTVHGSGFLPTSVAMINGQGVPTTYVSPAELKAEFTIAILDQFLKRAIEPDSTKGLRIAATVTPQFTVSVFNPTPGGGEATIEGSADQLVLENAVPVLTSISPSGTSAILPHASDLTLTLNGNNFHLASIVNFGALTYSPATVSGTLMTVVVPKADLPAGTVQVSVTNPSPGGGTTASLPFQVYSQMNPSPAVASVSPSSIAAGAAQTTVTVQGSGFMASTAASLNGVAGTVAGNSISFALPASQLVHAATLSGTIDNSEPGGGSAGFTVNVLNPAPAINGFSPSSALAGTPSVSLQVSGSNFRSGSELTFEGTAVSTMVVSPTELSAVVTEGFLRRSGRLRVGVSNPGPGGGSAEGGLFTINSPQPVLTAVSPPRVAIQSVAAIVALTGSGFTANSNVTLNGETVDAVFESATTLIATIPATLLQRPVTYDVQVINPAPGGGSSETVKLAVDNTVPVIDQVVPDSIRADQQNIALQISGRNFAETAMVSMGGFALATTVISPTALTAALPQPVPLGRVGVSVTNPPPGGGTSNSIEIEVTALPPTITSVTPSPASAGQLVRLTGSNFGLGSVVYVDGLAVPTTVLSANELTATIPALTPLGPADVIVRNPPTTNNPPAQSASTAIAIVNPTPAIASLDPSRSVAGARITINGSGFLAVSLLTVNGTAVASTFVDGTTLTFVAPASLSAGAAAVVVTNPAPGGGSSAAATLTITSPVPVISGLSPVSALSGSAVVLTISGTNFVDGAIVEFAGTQTAAIVASAASLSASIAVPNTAGFVSVRVLNPGGIASNTLPFAIARPPVLHNISPGGGEQGQAVTVSISGENFTEGALVSVSADGVNVTNIVVNSSTELVASFVIAGDASAGVRSVSVATASGGASAARLDFVISRRAPGLVAITPVSGMEGTSIPVVLSGSGFSGNGGISGSVTGVLVSGAGVGVTNISTVSDGSITAIITIAADALPGPRSVTVTTTAGITGYVTFIVQAATGTPTLIGERFVVTHLSGSVGGAGYTDGAGPAARFNAPGAITGDGANIYIADSGNNTIRKADLAAGTVTTLAGIAGEVGSSGIADATGSAARFGGDIHGLWTDGTNLFVADTKNNAIRQIVITTGEVTTLAEFQSPKAIWGDGTVLYVTDTATQSIRKIVVASGAVSMLALVDANNQPASIDGWGIWGDATATYLYITSPAANAIYRVRIATGAVTTLTQSVTAPRGIWGDGTYLYVASYDKSIVQRVDIPSGAVTTLPATLFNSPDGVWGDGTSVFVSDSGNNTIRKIAVATSLVTTVLGQANETGSADGASSAARFRNPTGVWADASSLYVTDTDNHAIRRIAIATGDVTTLAGTAATFTSSRGIWGDGASLYVADCGNNVIRKVVIATREITTLAGSGVPGSMDSTGLSAQFNCPYGIWGDGQNLFVTDQNNRAIRRIVIATGAVSTLPVFSAQSTTSVTASLGPFVRPAGIWSDRTNLYVADSGNGMIWKVALATNQAMAFTAPLEAPQFVWGDGTNLYATIAGPQGASTVRRISLATGAVTTIAGYRSGSDDSASGTFAQFVNAAGIWGSSSALFVVDSGNNTIRKLTAEVLAPPVLLSLEPVSVPAGTTLTLVAKGNNFVRGGTTVAVNDSSIAATNTVAASPVLLNTTLFVPSTVVSGSHSLTVATAAGISNTLTFTVTQACVPTIALGKNLVRNAGAEGDNAVANDTSIVSPSCWQTTGSMTAVRYGTSPFPSTGNGLNFFAGGPRSTLSTATQTFDVSGFVNTIDTTRLTATLGALLGGDATLGGQAAVEAQFFSGSVELGNVTIGPAGYSQTKGSFTALNTTVNVPIGTRSIVVTITAAGVAGAYNHGYADNVSLVLNNAPGPDRLWIGGSAANPTSWQDAANWSPSGVPTASQNVLIPATANQPVLTAGAAVQNLTVASGAVLNTSSSSIIVYGNMAVSGLVTGTGTTIMVGTDKRIYGNVASLAVTGTITAEKAVTVSGDLAIAGIFDAGPNAVTVNGQLSTLAGIGLLVMNNDLGSVTVSGNASFAGGDESALLNAGVLRVKGNLAQLSSASTFAATGTHTVIMNGTTAQTINFAVSLNAYFQHLQIANTAGVTLSSNAVVNGDVQVKVGVLNLNGMKLSVAGSFSTTGTGALKMVTETSQLEVVRDVVFGGGSTTNLLTAGVIGFGGSFNQLNSGTTTDTFAASGAHRVIFDTFPGQPPTHNVAFASFQSSHFNILKLENTDRLSLLSNAVAAGQLIASSTGIPKQIAGGAHTLTVGGIDVDGLGLDNVLLVIQGGTITKFDNVQFSNYPDTATQLTVRHPGGQFVFNFLTFVNPPTTGVYIDATDTAPTDSNALTITLINPSSAAQSSRTKVSGGAVIIWR